MLLGNLDKLHTTSLGAERIRRNLKLTTNDIVGWCIDAIAEPDARISRKGKNWYVYIRRCVITVNAHSYTIITAHPDKSAGDGV